MSKGRNKRKKGKDSPDAVQNSPKRPAPSTMNQHGGHTGSNNGSNNGTQSTPTNLSTNSGGSNTPVMQGHSGQFFTLPSVVQQIPTNMNYNNQMLAMNTASPFIQAIPQTSTPIQNVQSNMQTMQSNDVLSAILQRLDSMDQKLGQLDYIQSCVSAITVRVNNVEQKLEDFEKRMVEIENSKTFDASILVEIQNKQKELDRLMSKIQNQETEQRIIENELKSEISDLKCRSMRDNLMFYKLPEERDENCEEKIQQFIKEKLKIDDGEPIRLHRAHRVGQYDSRKCRPIVAKFVFYQDRERVRKSAKELRGTNFGISEQFPKQVMEARRQLIPIMKKAREEGKEAYLRIDKLYIDKHLYKPQNVN